MKTDASGMCGKSIMIIPHVKHWNLKTDFTRTWPASAEAIRRLCRNGDQMAGKIRMI